MLDRQARIEALRRAAKRRIAALDAQIQELQDRKRRFEDVVLDADVLETLADADDLDDGAPRDGAQGGVVGTFSGHFSQERVRAIAALALPSDGSAARTSVIESALADEGIHLQREMLVSILQRSPAIATEGRGWWRLNYQGAQGPCDGGPL